MLNAFRHHWNLHSGFLSSYIRTVPVLNAFRHHWNLHFQGFGDLRGHHIRCSTPFGIIGIFTGGDFAWRTFPPECSTPFGIIGIFTFPSLLLSRLTVSAQRLSASLESSRRGNYGRRARRVEVLNAFRHHWNLHLTQGEFNRLAKHVLNAFRHHWNLHPCHRAEGQSCTYVLNAFRHHWNLHVIKMDDSTLRGRCSTPFGIIGIFTQALRVRLD